jgi:hypothetical protein
MPLIHFVEKVPRLKSGIHRTDDLRQVSQNNDSARKKPHQEALMRLSGG